ncbi:MAG TPA: ATP-binding protein [Candidatus Limnocylindria bacterium]|jgi:signal transduction histidine kinase
MTHVHLPNDAIVERLRVTPLFGGLEDAELTRLAELGEVVDLAPGELLIREGELADALYVVLDGELEVTKLAGTSEIPLALVGPGALQGEIAALEGGRRLASVRASGEAEVLRIPIDAIRQLLDAGPDVALAVIRTAVGRLRSMEATLREREKLAGLGTLAAGLAHELNNPAAAALRSVRSLETAVSRAEELPHPVPPPRPPEGTPAPRSALDRADRIAELETFAGDADGASALVEAGWTPEALAAVPADAVAWLAADASVRQLLGELSMALERISEIVAAVKGYSYLDQAPVQRVDVRVGLEQTLVILRHKLREIAVTVELAADLPEIEAFGSELNQVWTNIVDNAVDAMDGPGSLLVEARGDPGGTGVIVTICNSGPPIPDEVRARLFEPFYTTKEPGRGTGLGLHISHNVVVRHGGRIEVETGSDRTCFVVTLPSQIAREAQPTSG